MNLDDILSKVDHTLLSPTATFEDICNLLDEAVKYKVASVCIPPSFVSRVLKFGNSMRGNVKICTVIGFPNGYNTTATKQFETQDAINNGADEIDMVINLGWVKEGKYSQVEKEIKLIKEMCEEKILKVIVETCLLTEDEKINLCKVVSQSGADFIKTSTGFSTSGAKLDDIFLFKKHIDKHVKIKAAGGIKTLKDAEDFIDAGASRLGTSRIIKLVSNE